MGQGAPGGQFVGPAAGQRPGQYDHGDYPAAQRNHLYRRIIGADKPFAEGVDAAHAEHAQYHKADAGQIAIAVSCHATPVQPALIRVKQTGRQFSYCDRFRL